MSVSRQSTSPAEMMPARKMDGVLRVTGRGLGAWIVVATSEIEDAISTITLEKAGLRLGSCGSAIIGVGKGLF